MFVLRELEDAAELVERADAGAHLPAPVIPFGGRRVGVEASIKGPRFGIDGEAESFLPGGRLDRGWADIGLYGCFRNRGWYWSLAPRGRAKIAPSQELEIHRCLMLLYSPDLDAPYGRAHQTAQRR